MRVEFNQGVPVGCVEWLWENVGPGNLTLPRDSTFGYNFVEADNEEYLWFYKQEWNSNRRRSVGGWGVWRKSITVKDEKLAMLFVLRWL